MGTQHILGRLKKTERYERADRTACAYGKKRAKRQKGKREAQRPQQPGGGTKMGGVVREKGVERRKTKTARDRENGVGGKGEDNNWTSMTLLGGSSICQKRKGGGKSS